MSKQLLRAGTSIGANIAESLASESEDDFIHKLTIAQKEASETKYWLTLLFKTDFLSEALYHSLTNDCMELLRILSAIIVKMKSKHKKLTLQTFSNSSEKISKQVLKSEDEN